MCIYIYNINPCINEEWDGYEVTRPFRNNVYNIIVYNKEHKQTGVSYLVVDGVKQETNLVKYVDDGREHTVEVYM